LRKVSTLLLKLTWLEDFDNNSLISQSVDTLVHFRVLSPSNFLDNFIVILGPERKWQKR